MTLAQIIEGIKNNTLTQEFQNADQRVNFSFKFKKTMQFWSKTNWKEVAREVKKETN